VRLLEGQFNGMGLQTGLVVSLREVEAREGGNAERKRPSWEESKANHRAPGKRGGNGSGFVPL